MEHHIYQHRAHRKKYVMPSDQPCLSLDTSLAIRARGYSRDDTAGCIEAQGTRHIEVLRKMFFYFLAFLWVTLPNTIFAQSSSPATAKPIKLLEPLPDGTSEISAACAGNPFFILNTYLNPMMTWGIGIAAGISVLMVIIGGFQILLSGGDQSAIQNGKDRIKSALFGLLLLVLSGTFLNLLNAYFFKLNPGAPPGC